MKRKREASKWSISDNALPVNNLNMETRLQQPPNQRPTSAVSQNLSKSSLQRVPDRRATQLDLEIGNNQSPIDDDLDSLEFPSMAEFPMIPGLLNADRFSMGSATMAESPISSSSLNIDRDFPM